MWSWIKWTGEDWNHNDDMYTRYRHMAWNQEEPAIFHHIRHEDVMVVAVKLKSWHEKGGSDRAGPVQSLELNPASICFSQVRPTASVTTARLSELMGSCFSWRSSRTATDTHRSSWPAHTSGRKVALQVISRRCRLADSSLDSLIPVPSALLEYSTFLFDSRRLQPHRIDLIFSNGCSVLKTKTNTLQPRPTAAAWRAEAL